ncbi:MAG: LptF/LptG family permease [Armatimonadota bacterium]|nr:LptF/LptG family permease [Armatimonadota bacterium]MDR7532428.1 LptF/LptG family permease [Armatimonadota bacterium]MDR7535651.1 LptF/LptG family permease [Armatimonadota bacterium]
MRRLDRYILREVGGVFVFGIGLFTTLLALNHIFFLARVTADAGAPWRAMFTLLVLRLPYFVSYSLPMAMLLATLLAFGRLSDRNEITAMRTSGWSLGRVALPVLVAAGVIAGVALGANEWVVPVSESRYRAVLAEVVRAPRRQVQEHVVVREPIDGLESLVYARELHPADGAMRQVVIVQLVDARPARVIEAEEARYDPQEGWTLRRGVVHLFAADGAIATRFVALRVRLARTPPQIAAARRDPAEMTIRELRDQIARLRATGENVARYAVNLHAKVALPLSAAIFALLAVPLGLRPHRSGRSVGLGLTILILLVYYFALSMTITLGERGRLQAFWAAWTPNLIVAAAGVLLLWRAR